MQKLLNFDVRFPKFKDGDMSEIPIGNGIDLISGQHVPAVDCNTVGEGFPYLTGPSDFPHGEKSNQQSLLLNLEYFGQKGDILMTVKGSGVGSMTTARSSYCISRQLMALRPTKFDKDFLRLSN